MASYAIVQTGGRQYRVASGTVLDVEKLDVEVGALVDLPVLMVSDEDQIVVGNPNVEGARVVAEVQDQFRGPKIIIFKYKAKTRYRRKNGHRQSYTRLHVQDIITGQGPDPEPAPEEEPPQAVDALAPEAVEGEATEQTEAAE
jgi:large subunit ribosomal protein L21